MAFEIQGNSSDLPYQASSNVTALTYSGNPPVYASGGIPQYAVVSPDTGTGNESDVILAANGAGNIFIGIAQDGPATGPGESLRVRVSGVSKAIASAAITVGQLVTVANSSGQLGPAPAAGATSSFIVGRAETPATEVGDLFSVLLMIGASTQVSS